MRALVLAGVVALLLAPGALAMRASATVRSAGLTLRLPAGWHASVATTPQCDPERLIAASSSPLRVGSQGAIAAPRSGQVVVLVLEDRYPADRPAGDLQRPSHFSLAWNHLTSFAPASFCGSPIAPAAERWIRSNGRFIGFAVYPGAAVGAQAKAQTLALMDSLRVYASGKKR